MPRTLSAAARRTARRAMDRRFEGLRELVPAAAVPHGGWVRALREALGMSRADLGARMGVAVTTVLSLERRERDGKVQLDTLRRAADALGCDLAYALVPRQSLESTVATRAQVLADEHLRRVGHSMALEDQQVLPSTEREQAALQAARLIDRPGLWRDG